MMKRIACLLFLLLPGLLLAARIAVAPLDGDGLAENEFRVARNLLINALQKERPRDLVVPLEESSDAPCSVSERMDAAREQAADQLALVSLDRLGGKLIVQVRLLDVASDESLFADTMPLSSDSELDLAMQRVAEAIARRRPLKDLAAVGGVLADEGLETRLRSALRVTTLQAGYLWPLGQDYDRATRIFTGSIATGIEEKHFAAGFQFAWRDGPAALLYSDWLIRPDDICPFVGLGVGFHWVRHKEAPLFAPDGMDHDYDDGLHLALRGGLLLYRTYGLQMVLQTEYALTFNDHRDEAFLLVLGVRP
jgi:hypothetical protein